METSSPLGRTVDSNTSDNLALVASPFNASYYLVVDGSNFTGGGNLVGFEPTVPRSNRAPAGSPRDSDGVNLTVPGLGAAIGSIVNVGAAGQNDQRLASFIPCHRAMSAIGAKPAKISRLQVHTWQRRQTAFQHKGVLLAQMAMGLN